MDGLMSNPLVPAHVPKAHPLVTREYSLFTPAIAKMVEIVAHWLDEQVDGATLFGPSRFGKSSAVDHWLQSLLSERFGGHVPLVIWSHTSCGGASSVGQFHAHLLLASRHPLAKAIRSPLERQHMLIERWTALASQDGGRFLVLVIDEAQGMTQREWLWLVELHSLLEKDHIRLCVISIASLQFFDEPIGLALSGGAHVAARFMLCAKPFHGVCGAQELKFVLSGYDEGTEWPQGSGRSFTAGLAPEAWAAGFRMAEQAEGLFQAMQDDLPTKYAGPLEFPMKTVAQCARHALLRIAGGANPSDVTSPASWRDIVAGTDHRALMAIVSASVSTSRLRGKAAGG